MAFVSLLRANIMPNYLKLSHTRLIIPQLCCHQTARLFSSGIQRSPYVPRNTVSRATPSSRSYWWSSSASSVLSPPSPPLPLPPKEPPTPSEEVPAASATSHEPLQPVQTASAEPATPNDPVVESVKPPPSGVDSVVSDVPVDVSLPDFSPPPLQFGDFIGLGLSGFGPGGIVATSFEWIQVSTGMPWFYTIIVGTILWRFVMAYFSIKQLRYSTLLRNAPQVDKAQEAVAAAKASGDQNQIRLSAAKVQKAYKDAGVSPLSMVFLSLIQFLPPLGLFIGVQRMCNLPVEQLKHSGVSFLPDLTLVSGTAAFDPYYIMPVLGVVAMNLQLKLLNKDVNANSSKPNHYINMFRVITPLMILFTRHFPAGLTLSIVTGIAGSMVQTALLRLPRVRRKLNIPRLPPNASVPPSVFDTWKFVKEKVPGWRAKYFGGAEKKVDVKAQSIGSSRRKPLHTPKP